MKRLQNLYPSVYLYFPWGKVFYEGQYEKDPKNFIDTKLDYTLYIDEYSDELLHEVKVKLQASMNGYEVIIVPLLHIIDTREAVFQVNFRKIKI